MADSEPALARAREDDDRLASMMDTVVDLMFSCLPLSVQARTAPLLSKQWKEWAEEQRLKERALEQAKREAGEDFMLMLDVPLWVAQQQPQPGLSAAQKRRGACGALASTAPPCATWAGAADTAGFFLRLSMMACSLSK